MKVQELQIGDLVAYNGNVIKVTGLNAKRGSNVLYYTESEDLWLNCDLVTPIPVTKNILYKIGFVYNQKKMSLEYGEGKKLQLNPVCIKHEYVWQIKNMDIIIRYFHELQHVLRVFGITKVVTF